MILKYKIRNAGNQISKRMFLLMLILRLNHEIE